jgi:hypothetical protein
VGSPIGIVASENAVSATFQAVVNMWWLPTPNPEAIRSREDAKGAEQRLALVWQDLGDHRTADEISLRVPEDRKVLKSVPPAEGGSECKSIEEEDEGR